MVGYGRHRSRQYSTGKQSDRCTKTAQSKEQHPAVGMPQVRYHHPGTKDVRVICADCMELFVKAD